MVKITLSDLNNIAENGANSYFKSRRRFANDPQREQKHVDAKLYDWMQRNPPRTVVVKGAAVSIGDNNTGMTTSDIAWRAEVIKQFLYKEADQITVGTKIADVQTIDRLDARWSFPTEIQALYPVPEGVRTLEQNVQWQKFDNKLRKLQLDFNITDETFMRGGGTLQRDTTLRRAADALALRKDEEIIDVLYAGRGTTVAAIDNWDDLDSATTSIITDIAEGMIWILENTNITDTSLKNLKLIVPKAFMPVFLVPRDINDIKTNYKDFFTSVFNVEILPTKTRAASAAATDVLYDRAMLAVAGPDTAIHQVYSPPAGIDVAMVEVERKMAVGWDYAFRQWFGTTIIPFEQDGTANNRIYMIDDIRE